jgi:hypothetical protein
MVHTSSSFKYIVRSGRFIVLRNSCRIKSGGEPALLAVVLSALPETRTPNPRAAMRASQHAVTVFPVDVVDEKVLRGHDISLHAEDLGNESNPA